MRPRSRSEASKLGRVGGKENVRLHPLDRDRARRMQRQRAAKAQKRHYPGLWEKWILNATRVRLGLPLEPVPQVGRWGETDEAREARALEQRRRDRATISN
jgi:hypothetical protein